MYDWTEHINMLMKVLNICEVILEVESYRLEVNETHFSIKWVSEV